MAETVADQVFARVEALMGEAAASSRAAAIRRVADEMDRSPSATSSAYYAGARKAREAGAAPSEPVPAPGRSRRRDSPSLYEDMLPLVEAGASPEQAARRFGRDEEAAAEIAAGFTRWRAREDAGTAGAEPGARLAELEAEVSALRRELDRARRSIARAQGILAEAAGDGGGTR